ncbi:endonuclease dU [Methanolobus profundi]|uniref:UPF0215 protein SAMN04488696_1253 n=1 Tax=Methanolobus profundi TaxID=487685 RepID=A0A1I4QY76_9EURY|nr:DUF99 family protein [Methanolobus profundi]SFM44775.1 hypothetical protein SAMN04488696_1253 [Methanolobus profundi]
MGSVRPFHIKDEIRILGIDDSALITDTITIVGAFFRGGQWLDGVLRSEITRDGLDATDKIVEMVLRSKHFPQIRAIMLDGITYGGFNPVDIIHLNKETDIPVIVLMRDLPNFEKIEDALSFLPEKEKRTEIIKNAGPIHKVVTKDRSNPVFIQCCGIEPEFAAKIVKISSTRSNIPEPLRVAHLIATGIVLGESRGKA